MLTYEEAMSARNADLGEFDKLVEESFGPETTAECQSASELTRDADPDRFMEIAVKNAQVVSVLSQASGVDLFDLFALSGDRERLASHVGSKIRLTSNIAIELAAALIDIAETVLGLDLDRDETGIPTDSGVTTLKAHLGSDDPWAVRDAIISKFAELSGEHQAA